jgi:hypothetical protein
MFMNIVHTGISSTGVEEMEDRLKLDILNESKLYEGKIMLHEENETGGLFTTWEDVTQPGSVLTTRGVYDLIRQEGYNIKFVRTPITDERAPEIKDFDELIGEIKDCDFEKVHLIYNCQMGRGRTTTGTIIASLLAMAKSGKKLVIKRDPIENETQNYMEGNYKVINKLCRILTNANENKDQVDEIIDNASQMQNLRTSIYEFKLKGLNMDASEETRRVQTERCSGYLERYFLLIVFNEYVMEQSERKDERWMLFEEWLAEREEITGLLVKFNQD